MILVATSAIALDVPDDADAESIAASLDNGLLDAVAHFPAGEVIGARVESIRPARDGEAEENGWVE